MDADSDNDAGFEVGRHRASPASSRESSPVAKRPRRSFTPTSDDDNIVVTVAHNEDSETPIPENAPLIRQAVGFSSVTTNVNTYQATVAQPVVPYFLPGQAPAPPKPKPKPRAPRKKKGEHFSSQTSKFKLTCSAPSHDSGFASIATTSTAHTSPSNGAGVASMIPVSSYLSGYTNDRPVAGSNVNSHDDLRPGAKRPRKRKAPGPPDAPDSQPNVRPSPGDVPTPTAPRRTSTPVERSLPATATAQNAQRPLRMITLLIEDMRNGVSDLQLAEVKVPLKIANDPEDGFWADAEDVCEALQCGPSRIDGPAKVYTMRGKYRQFFMRVDQYDQSQAQSAHLGVSKSRTLNIFVEAPMQPRPPVPPSDGRPGYSSGSEREATVATFAETCRRPTFEPVTREDQIERLSKSSYVVPQRGRYSPESDAGSYGHSQRTASPHRASRHDQYAGPSRSLTPPILGRRAETEEEMDEAVTNYIRSHIENQPGWMDYMQSTAKPQRVSEVLKQYAFVEDCVRELVGRKTPAHWDGAPRSYVERYHVWRVLRLDAKWYEDCRETLRLVGFYGKNGSRCEDPRVIDMINDMSPPRSDAMTMERFLRLLRDVDEAFTRDTFHGGIPRGP